MKILCTLIIFIPALLLLSANIVFPIWEEEARVKQIEDQKKLDFDRAAAGLEHLGAKPGDLIVCKGERGLRVYTVCDFNPRSRPAYVNDGSGSKLWAGSSGENCAVVKSDDSEFSNFTSQFLIQVQQASN